MNKRMIGRLKCFLVCTSLLLFMQLIKTHTDYIYLYYTSGLYPIIKTIQGTIASVVKFSYGEILVGSLIFLGIVLIVSTVRQYFYADNYQSRSEIFDKIASATLGFVNLVLLTVIVFHLLWGFNYHQPSLFVQLGLNRQTVNVEEFISTLEPVIDEVNNLRRSLDKTPEDLVYSKKSVNELMQQAYEDYGEASKTFYFIQNPASPPKAIASSLIFSYNGVSGIYNPFTGEANVNQLNSQFMIPVVALHELSHQQGNAREDEANFLAYIVANDSEDNFSRYSGNLLLLIHGLNNLKKIDLEEHKALYETLSKGVINDLRAHRELWAKYEGPLEESHEKINDAYLKANGQQSGTKSYSEMIELYVAWTLKNE